MTHINIGRSFVILNFNHSVSLKGIPSEKFEKYANKFYFSKYENRQRHNEVKIILKSHNNFLCFWKFTKTFVSIFNAISVYKKL